MILECLFRVKDILACYVMVVRTKKIPVVFLCRESPFYVSNSICMRNIYCEKESGTDSIQSGENETQSHNVCSNQTIADVVVVYL
jgi:hypothetical protein